MLQTRTGVTNQDDTHTHTGATNQGLADKQVRPSSTGLQPIAADTG